MISGLAGELCVGLFGRAAWEFGLGRVGGVGFAGLRPVFEPLLCLILFALALVLAGSLASWANKA